MDALAPGAHGKEEEDASRASETTEDGILGINEQAG